jgi:hypothetical protein
MRFRELTLVSSVVAAVRSSFRVWLASLAMGAALVVACSDSNDGSSSQPCTDGTCQPNPKCDAGKCACTGNCGDAACTKKSCADISEACGEYDDGCGGTLLCDDACPSESTYYVGGANASDTNPGTYSQPFATIQAAADVAVGGEVVRIRSGVYRETVNPANSGTEGNPIEFRPDGEADLVVSGADTADGGWTVHSGDIYKKSVTLPVDGYNLTMSDNTTLLANQVFKDGVMMFEARWPKQLDTPADLLDRAKVFRGRLETSNFDENSLTDSGIPDIPGGWAGGTVFISGWFISQTRTITSHSGTTIEYANTNPDLRFLQYYYLTGKLGALTQAKEWHYEAGTLYFWQPGGDSPTGVEFKARNWCFDLRGRSHITVRGLGLFACDINGDTDSASVVVDGIKAKYLNHAVRQEGSDVIYANAKQSGMKLVGPNSVIRNSELQYAASQAVWLGENCVMENNLVRDINYEANYGAGVTMWETTGGQKVLHNTITRVGRSAVDFSGYPTLGQHLNMEIAYNDVYDFGMLHADSGGMYCARMADLTGTRIHHNWIHDNRARVTPVTEHEVGINAGLYFDQACGPSTVHHNVFWNNYQTDYTIQNSSTERNAGPTLVYNNTFATSGQPEHVWARSYVTFTTAFENMDVQRNNIYRDDLFFNWDTSPSAGNVQNYLLDTQDPSFISSEVGGLNYRLAAGSAAIDAGVVLPGITDDSIGTPDIGAYEYGGTDWVPGYSPP